MRLIPRHQHGGDSVRNHLNGQTKLVKRNDDSQKKRGQKETRDQLVYVDTGPEAKEYRQGVRLRNDLGVDEVYQPADQFDDTGAVRSTYGASNVLPEITAGADATNGVKKANNLPTSSFDDITVIGDKNKRLTPYEQRVRDYRESIKEEELAKPALLRRIGAGLDLTGLALSRTPAAMATPFLIGAGYASNFGADYIDNRNKEWYGSIPESGDLGQLDNAVLDGTYYGMQLGQNKFPWMRYAKFIPLAGQIGSDTYTLTTGKPLL